MLDFVLVENFESLILFVSDLAESRRFYVEGLGLPVLFEGEIIVAVGFHRRMSCYTETTEDTTSEASLALEMGLAVPHFVLRSKTLTLVKKRPIWVAHLRRPVAWDRRLRTIKKLAEAGT